MRLARLDATQGWGGDLNPTQRAMLGYLGQANRFSRSPSHVADYLGTTRGTATQSLKSLQQKGYVTERRSEVDKRVISYELTDAGQSVTSTAALLETAISKMEATQKQAVERILQDVLVGVLAANKGRAFGLCKTCKHHQDTKGAPRCGLLNVALTREEVGQICHEQVSA